MCSSFEYLLVVSLFHIRARTKLCGGKNLLIQLFFLFISSKNKKDIVRMMSAWKKSTGTPSERI